MHQSPAHFPNLHLYVSPAHFRYPFVGLTFLRKTTAEASVYRTLAKSRLSSPTRKRCRVDKLLCIFWLPLLDSNQRPAD